ncbi:hypothetical protein [Marinobacter alkaliphilus]|uniref:hypothetical protein n=1 Tax=Marinobacter alkaliphilus TaxID=254719 RepID=UPI003D80E1E1|nr:hypothetical protein PBN92_12540 [Marinobacter alkaliphilus]
MTNVSVGAGLFGGWLRLKVKAFEQSFSVAACPAETYACSELPPVRIIRLR